MISGLFWQAVKTKKYWSIPVDRDFDSLREQADYNTGSMSSSDMMDIIEVTDYFQPKVIAEVGTFIGRSTYSLATAAGDGALIYTCDSSNDIKLPLPPPGSARVIQCPRTSSTDMFRRMLADGHANSVDLLYIDGRLTEEDNRLVFNLSHKNTVFVLDDFEGIEKGVANAFLLLRERPEYMLVYPKPEGKTAVLVPFGLVQFTPQ